MYTHKYIYIYIKHQQPTKFGICIVCRQGFCGWNRLWHGHGSLTLLHQVLQDAVRITQTFQHMKNPMYPLIQQRPTSIFSEKHIRNHQNIHIHFFWETHQKSSEHPTLQNSSSNFHRHLIGPAAQTWHPGTGRGSWSCCGLARRWFNEKPVKKM